MQTLSDYALDRHVDSSYFLVIVTDTGAGHCSALFCVLISVPLDII